MSPNPLEELQQGMLSDIQGLVPDSSGARSLVFRRPPQGTIEERWHVYTSGYLVRLEEAIEHDYPAVRRIVGPAPFAALVARYAHTYPPRSYDLGRAGDRLASFLERDVLTEALPFLPDLARLEWSLAEAFVAEDVRPLNWSELQSRDPVAVSETPLVLLPGVRLLRSAWPLLDLWRSKDIPDPEVSVEVLGRPSIVLVFRRGLESRCLTIDEAEARFLELAAMGASLTEMQERWEGADDPLVVQEILNCFRRFVDEGLFQNQGGRR